MNSNLSYWIAISQLPRWRTKRINEILIKIFHDYKIPLDEFFNLGKNEWLSKYELTSKETDDLVKVKTEVPNYSFLVENLQNEGYELIPVTASEYPPLLKINLKTSSPPLLYIKGDKQIFTEKSIAVVGSRNATEKSLLFTAHIVKRASKEFKVIVSGFAKGVDRQALDSAVEYFGRSIIVLPQGIMTFGTGFKQYYKQIINGDVVVLSSFFPKLPWSVECAMARNPVIYGLADEIYVAESNEKGGTWSGVKDGLRKGRKIFVRQAEDNENNANNKLIEMGAVPVDFDGSVIELKYEISPENQNNEIKESGTSVDVRIYNLLSNKSLSAVDILKALNLDWSPKKLSDYLKKLNRIERTKIKNKYFYRIKSDNDSFQEKIF